MRLFLLTAAATATVASASIVNPMADYSLITFQDFRTTSDVEGRMLVGRDLLGSGTLVKNLPTGNFDGVTVGRDVNGNFNLQAGNLRYGNSRTGSFNFNGGGVAIQDPGAGSIVPSIEAMLRNTSTLMAALSPNSSVTPLGVQPAGITFTASPDANGVAVFSIDASLLSSNLAQSFDIVLNGATDVIINVAGSAANVAGGNFNGNFNTPAARSAIIWNFHEASTINVDRGFSGSILGVDATLTGNSPIDGSVAVFSADIHGELHLPTYGGNFGGVPSPAGSAVLGFAGLIASRRRRIA
ncbi:MAG: choice-of-anchor A family protein [Phycisphaerales bacterium]|jgi:choice-of-anchor A domain-containing protein|nr:choice-of-anchor A family protein [Phycisphaerales bacterium]